MADYPRFPKITPNIGDTSETFQTGPKPTYGEAPTHTTSYAKAGSINGGAQDALNQMEQWADSLNDKLSADQVQIRNSVQQDQFGSISIRGRLRLNENLTNPDTAETTPLKGQIRFNVDTNKFQGYDGTAWRDFH